MLVAVLFLPVVLLSVLAMLALVVAMVLFAAPSTWFTICSGFVAGIVWVALAIPSLVSRGDLHLPRRSAKAIVGPGLCRMGRVADGHHGGAFDWLADAVNALWSGYGNLARRVRRAD